MCVPAVEHCSSLMVGARGRNSEESVCFYSWMLLTLTAITLTSPPRHSQVFNGRFIISITFDHKLAKFGMYILSCVSQQTNLWLRFSEFLLMADLLHSLVNVSSECCFSPAFMHDEAVGFSLNKSPGHIKQSGLKEVYSILLSLCVSCPITTSEHKEASAACVVRQQRRYRKKKNPQPHPPNYCQSTRC